MQYSIKSFFDILKSPSGFQNGVNPFSAPKKLTNSSEIL